MMRTTVDQISVGNTCEKHPSKLKEVNIKDLKANKPAQNCILWGNIVSEPAKMTSIMFIIQDSLGQFMSLALYN